MSERMPGEGENRVLWRSLTCLVILGITLFRIAYVAFWCPLDLAPDEAHYWDWSRNLDWSYYSKGPLVAWLIRGSCELFGTWSISLTGSEVLALRLPAILCGSLLLVSLYCLTTLVYRREQWSFLVVLCALTWPAINAASLLMTIDSPFVCIWSWTLVTGYYAFIRQKSWAWIVTGMLIGLGILAKYTMALWVFSAGLFCLFTPSARTILFQRGFWMMSVVTGVFCLPILYWNWQNDWVTFRHVATQAGVQTAQTTSSIRWLGPLEYLGGQFGLLLGYWFVAWVAAMIVCRPYRESRLEIRYLWWMSLPTFVLFGLVSIKAGVQINWPVTAYLSGMILALAWVMQQVSNPAPGYRKLAQVGLSLICLLGLSLTVIVLDSRTIQPMIAQLVGPPTEQNPFPIRKLDPTCRLRGWNYLASQVDTIRKEIAQKEGVEPIITGLNWMLPGHLGFYCEGHPKVYSLGLVFGDRHSQYDLWRPNPLEDAQVFQGKTFVFVGFGGPKLKDAFQQVDPPREVIYRESGNPIAGWSIWVCRGYKGFDLTTQNQHPGRY